MAEIEKTFFCERCKTQSLTDIKCSNCKQFLTEKIEKEVFDNANKTSDKVMAGCFLIFLGIIASPFILYSLVSLVLSGPSTPTPPPAPQQYSDRNTGSYIYQTYTEAYKMAVLDKGSPLEASDKSNDYLIYKRMLGLIENINTNFKPDPKSPGIGNATVHTQTELEKSGTNVSLLNILEEAGNLDKNQAGLVTYTEYLAAIIILSKK